MTLGEAAGWVAIVVTVASGFIQLSPIKINPWSWLAKSIGRALNGDVMKEVDNVKDDVKTIKDEMTDIKNDVREIREINDERDARLARRHILRFSDEILHEVLHSQEHYNEILMVITDYENYCKTHDGFKNQMASAAIQNITEKYNQHLRDKDFLQ